MIPALIVEDEFLSRENLASLISMFCPDLEIIGKAASVNEAIRLFKEFRPELVFLDIQLLGEDGFDFLDNKEIRKKKFDVIFTTAYDHYAIKAIRYSALDYILKPIDKQELINSVRKFSLRHGKDYDNKQKLKLLSEIISQNKFTKICLPIKNGYQYVNMDSILYLTSNGSYSTVIFEGGKSNMVSKSLAYFEDLLGSVQFVRIHRSFLVNLNKIISFNTVEDYVVLTDNSKLEVSYRKRKPLIKILRINSIL